VGLTALIVGSALIHICVTLGLLPTTGVTLPFISYGGSSLVVCLAAVGILLNIGSWRA
jgi:cell division protein FtsW